MTEGIRRPHSLNMMQRQIMRIKGNLSCIYYNLSDCRCCSNNIQLTETDSTSTWQELGSSPQKAASFEAARIGVTADIQSK